MATILRQDIPIEIENKLKELLALLNKKSENEAVLRNFEAQAISNINDGNCLLTKYTISFETVLMEN